MSGEKTNTLLMRTPEGIAFSFFIAGPVTRLMAWVVDLAAILTLTSVLGTALSLLGIVSLDLAKAISIFAFFVLQIGYGIIMEWFCRGQTLGKRLLRLRVIDVHGLHLHVNQIVIRNLLRFVDLLPAFYLLGGVSALLTRRVQRLGDIAANTIVIRNPRFREPDLDQLLSRKFNSLRDYPHLETRLRQRISPGHAAVALQALFRRDALDPEARIRLFRDIAGHFRSLVEFPPDASEGITDEQYVRNVLDLAFRPRRLK